MRAISDLSIFRGKFTTKLVTEFVNKPVNKFVSIRMNKLLIHSVNQAVVKSVSGKLNQFVCKLLLSVLCCSVLAACDKLGLGGSGKDAAAKEADARATGSACRYAGRALEDCYTLNVTASRAAIFAGWKDMNDYMRENKMEIVKPELTVQKKADDKDDSQDADAGSADSKADSDKSDTKSDSGKSDSKKSSDSGTKSKSKGE